MLKQLPFYKDRAGDSVLNLWMAKGRGVIVFCKVFYQLLILLHSVVAGFFAKAQQAKEKIVTDDVKLKVSEGYNKVNSSGLVQQVKTGVATGYNSGIVQTVKSGVKEGGLRTA